MRTFEYLLMVNAVFAVLLGVYLVLLRRETFFLANRVWLLGSAVVAFLVPLIPRPVAFATLLGITLPEVAAYGAEELSGPIWTDVLLGIYVLGVLFHLLRLVCDARAAWLGTRSKAGSEGYSFLWRVVVPQDLEGADRDAMVAHEQTHVRHGHSADVLLFRLAHAFNWFIPIWGLALREVRLVHEHTADAEARSHHSDYESLLLAQALGVPRYALANSFRSSHLKTRMNMLLKDPSKNIARIKYLLAAPLLVLSIAIASPISSAVPFRIQNEVVQKAEKMPEFPGGMEAMIGYLGSNVKYPKSKGATAEGVVHVQFVVEQNGALDKVVILKGVEEALNAEALRVVKGMPNWTPGMNNGKPVAVQMVLPIRFALD